MLDRELARFLAGEITAEEALAEHRGRLGGDHRGVRPRRAAEALQGLARHHQLSATCRSGERPQRRHRQRDGRGAQPRPTPPRGRARRGLGEWLDRQSRALFITARRDDDPGVLDLSADRLGDPGAVARAPAGRRLRRPLRRPRQLREAAVRLRAVPLPRHLRRRSARWAGRSRSRSAALLALVAGPLPARPDLAPGPDRPADHRRRAVRRSRCCSRRRCSAAPSSARWA